MHMHMRMRTLADFELDSQPMEQLASVVRTSPRLESGEQRRTKLQAPKVRW